MRRKIPVLVVLVASLCALTATVPAVAQAATCSNSWGADGHNGPWYVGSNQSLHGNTVVISCPGPATPWKVYYRVFKTSPDLQSQFAPIDVTRTGSGSTSFSVSTNPIGCNVGWLYNTFVHNVYTGGNITKPSGGKVIC